MESLREKLFYISTQNEPTTNKHIACQLLKDFYDNKFSSMKDLSAKTYISPSTLTKFCQSIGYSGYRELMIKLKLERDSYSFAFSKQPINNKEQNLFLAVENQIIDDLCRLAALQSEIKQVAELIISTRRTFIYASYQVNDSAIYMKNLIRIKKLEIYLNSLRITDLLQYSKITKNDCIIIILAGQDNYFLVETFNNYLRGRKTRPKIAILCTDSQKDKITTYDFRMVFDFFMDIKKYHYRKLYLDYLILQIYEHIDIK